METYILTAAVIFVVQAIFSILGVAVYWGERDTGIVVAKNLAWFGVAVFMICYAVVVSG